jgi:hypothetical protein
MEQPDQRVERFENARHVAETAHDAVGDAEDELVAANRARQEAGSDGEARTADARMSRAEADWLDRQTEAEHASRAREEERERLDPQEP